MAGGRRDVEILQPGFKSQLPFYQIVPWANDSTLDFPLLFHVVQVVIVRIKWTLAATTLPKCQVV